MEERNRQGTPNMLLVLATPASGPNVQALCVDEIFQETIKILLPLQYTC